MVINQDVSLAQLPTEVIGRIESFLLPSDCAHLSGTCRFWKNRWTAKRWERTFHLHYGMCRKKNDNDCSVVNEHYFLQRTQSFVGCCSDTCEEHSNNSSVARQQKEDDSNAIQFNFSSLLPSVYSFYVSLWENIEHAMLCYRRGDDESQAMSIDGLPPLSALSDWMRVMLFMIGLKPVAWNQNFFALLSQPWGRKREVDSTNNNSRVSASHNRSSLKQRRFDPMLAVQSIGTSMPAWKLACLLKEQGVECIRCRICNKIDLGSSPYAPQSSIAWIRPCRCPELVHRRCLERKLGLVIDRLYVDRRTRRWIFYDDTLLPAAHGHQNDTNFGIRGVAEVDQNNQLTHPLARCHTCDSRYCRSLRLPYDAVEVLRASLVDRLSLVRAFSTFAHFLLCIVFICGIEGMEHDETREYWTVYDYPPFVVLKWPVKHGGLLAAWQLQQCLMLHIFFSPRFAVIVDRLWLDMPSRAFYVKLYLYFVVTSCGLSISFLPPCQRMIEHLLEEGPLAWTYHYFSQCSYILEVLSVINLLQYYTLSAMVVGIFWRTNIRVFTVADIRSKSGTVPWRSRERHHSHPIYHGQWE
jgi:hypothetical protein